MISCLSEDGANHLATISQEVENDGTIFFHVSAYGEPKPFRIVIIMGQRRTCHEETRPHRSL
jgi:hypothetical protein